MFSNYELIYTVPINASFTRENIRLTYANHRGKIWITDVTSEDIKIVYEDPYLTFMPSSRICLIYPYLDESLEETDTNETTKSIAKSVYDHKDELQLIIKLETTQSIGYYMNNSRATRIDSIIYELMLRQKYNEIVGKCLEKLDDILVAKELSLDDNFDKKDGILKNSVQLFKYQKDNINWMCDLSERVIKRHNLITHKYNLYTDLFNDKFILINSGSVFPKNAIDNTDTDLASFKREKIIRFYGGNLISEMGLGKTIVSLYYALLTNRRKCHFYDFSKKCNYTFKRGIKKGLCCEKGKNGDDLFCDEHKNTLFRDKRILIYKNLNQFNLKSLISADESIKARGSLIICPNHLCEQWVDEYYDKFVNDKHILLIATKYQLDNITFGDLLFADIVVLSFNMFINMGTGSYLTSLDMIERVESPETLLNTFNWKAFFLFRWKNIFIDESHEIRNSSRGKKIISLLSEIKANCRWTLTGTPFANGISSYVDHLIYTTNFTSSTNVSNKSKREFLTSGIIPELIEKTKSLFYRSTKDSIQQEYISQPINEIVNLLDFTVEERSIYDSYLIGGHTKYSSRLIRLCCDSELYNETRGLIKNCKTLEEIQRVLLEYNETKLAALKEELDRNDNSALQKRYDNLSRTCNYLKAVIEGLDKVEEGCPICLDIIQKDQLTITRCGHKFCWECINQIIGNKRCPTCKMELSNEDIYFLVDNTNSIIMDDDKNSIIKNVKSTKIGSIIYFLKTSLQVDDKIIIFSQWDELLHKVGDYLTLYGIKHIFCSGSVYQKKRAIDTFMNDTTVKIIMLSSRNAASGINLTRANKIIFVEPIYGDREYRNNIESQAIGRANRIGQTRSIDIIRFLIKNTIEEDILENRIDDSKLRIQRLS